MHCNTCHNKEPASLRTMIGECHLKVCTTNNVYTETYANTFTPQHAESTKLYDFCLRMLCRLPTLKQFQNWQTGRNSLSANDISHYGQHYTSLYTRIWSSFQRSGSSYQLRAPILFIKRSFSTSAFTRESFRRVSSWLLKPDHTNTNSLAKSVGFGRQLLVG